MQGRPSKHPEPTVNIGPGKLLVTIFVCTAPFLYMMIFTDHDTPREQTLSTLFFLWFCFGPVLINLRKIHFPAAESKKL